MDQETPKPLSAPEGFLYEKDHGTSYCGLYQGNSLYKHLQQGFSVGSPETAAPNVAELIVRTPALLLMIVLVTVAE